MSRSTYPAIFKEIPLPILELFPFFHQIFKILILFVLYFKNYKRQILNLNCKHVQHVKIYLPCNCEVNLITHLGVIALFSSLGVCCPSVVNFHILIFSETTGPIATKLWWNGPDFQPRWPPSYKQKKGGCNFNCSFHCCFGISQNEVKF